MFIILQSSNDTNFWGKKWNLCNVLKLFCFRSLFQNSPSQKNDVFNLVIQDVGGIGQVLDYMYTSHLDINQDNVQALLDIAQCLQVPNVQSLCNTFLKPCPPPVEIPPFSLLGTEHDCLLGSSLPHDVDLHCLSEAQRPGSSTDTDHTKKMSFSSSTSSSGCKPSNSNQAPAEKQLVHGYKLRNFYSKQYFKQSALETSNANSIQGPGPLLVIEEQQCSLGISHGDNSSPVDSGTLLQPNPSSASVASEKNPVSSLMPSENLNIPNFGPADSSLNRPVRPKKAVYLKKYNYLRSQKAWEEICMESVHEPVLSCTKECQPEESVLQTEAPETLVEDNAVTEENVVEPTATPQHPSPSPLEPEEDKLKPQQQRGNRQHRCHMCGKIFKHPSNLELHKRSHTGINAHYFIMPQTHTAVIGLCIKEMNSCKLKLPKFPWRSKKIFRIISPSSRVPRQKHIRYSNCVPHNNLILA